MRVLVTFSILGVIALSGCSRNSSTAASKTETEQAIKAKMAAQPDLANAITVDVNADKNEVVLTGTVPTESLRTEAVQIAKSSREGVIVTDKIDVKPRELTRNDYTSDMAREQREKAKASGEK